MLKELAMASFTCRAWGKPLNPRTFWIWCRTANHYIAWPLSSLFHYTNVTISQVLSLTCPGSLSLLEFIIPTRCISMFNISWENCIWDKIHHYVSGRLKFHCSYQE
jgi:hypothetical protein